jgi:hypothetical protein
VVQELQLRCTTYARSAGLQPVALYGGIDRKRILRILIQYNNHNSIVRKTVCKFTARRDCFSGICEAVEGRY